MNKFKLVKFTGLDVTSTHISNTDKLLHGHNGTEVITWNKFMNDGTYMKGTSSNIQNVLTRLGLVMYAGQLQEYSMGRPVLFRKNSMTG